MLKLSEDIKQDIILYRQQERELLHSEEGMVQQVDKVVREMMLVVEEVVDIVMEQ